MISSSETATKGGRRKEVLLRKKEKKKRSLFSFSSWTMMKLYLTIIGIIGIVGNIYVWKQTTTITTTKQPMTSSERRQNAITNLENMLRQHNKYRSILSEQEKEQDQSDNDRNIIQQRIDASKVKQKQQVLKVNNASFTNDDDIKNIVTVFHNAGIELDDERILSTLPSWSTIVSRIGPKPQIYGLHTCKAFRDTIPAIERNVGSCGMFNSGTNLVTRLLKENCQIPERVAKYGWNNTFEKYGMGPFDAHGMRWQVPWGKHTAAAYKDVNKANDPVPMMNNSLLPVVTIRHPYDWMSSMCRHPYTAKWEGRNTARRGGRCPNVISGGQLHDLTVSYGGQTDTFDSLIHLWNGWYTQYHKASTNYPLLMVRFEDLIFHTKDVITQICDCAGGEIRNDRPFTYIVDSAKEGPGHGKVRTGMIDAWIKYGSPMPHHFEFANDDYQASKKYLDATLMSIFNYQHP